MQCWMGLLSSLHRNALEQFKEIQVGLESLESPPKGRSEPAQVGFESLSAPVLGWAVVQDTPLLLGGSFRHSLKGFWESFKD